MDVDGAERHLAHEMQPHHHHPGDPEEDDVEARHQHIAGVIARELGRLLRPVQGREGPERRGEPGVQHILVAAELDRLAVMPRGGGLGLGLLHGDEDLAVRSVPGRDLMAPPELARDAPGLDVAHPLEVGRGPLLRHEDGLALLHRGDGGLGELGRVDVPLIRQPGLDDHIRPVAMGHRQVMRLDLLDQPRRLEILHHLLARRLAGEAAIGRRHIVVQPRIGIEDVDHLQPMAPADLEIVEVMGRRDLDRAAAGLGIGIIVGDDGDQPVHQRQAHHLADQRLVALVLGMDRHGGVAQHGLGPGGGNDDVAARLAFNGIAEMPEMALHLPRHDLEIGNGGMELRVPIDQPLVAIDQALAVEIDEDLAHRMAEALVHGEALARPIRRGAEAAQLADDGAAGLRLPLPDLLEEGRSADGLGIGARMALGACARQHDPLSRQLPLDHRLGGDAGVIRAGLPEHVAPAHALVAHQHVLQGEGQRMADMEAARHIGRRHHDGEGGRRGIGVAGEIAPLLPALRSAEPRPRPG